MNLSRRSFLGGSMALIGASVLPKLPLDLPAIYGDGIRDDWAGLDALFHGRPVRLLTDAVTVSNSKEIWVEHGIFRLSRQLHLPLNGPKWAITDCRLDWVPPAKGTLVTIS